MNRYFDLYMAANRIYNLTISGFSFVLTWILRMRIPTASIVISKVLLLFNLVLDMPVPAPLLTITQLLFKITIKPVMTMYAGKNNLEAILHQVMKFTASFGQRMTMVANTRLIQRIIGLTVHVPKVLLTLSMTLAEYNKLWQFDPLPLYDMDGQTLAELDYRII